MTSYHMDPKGFKEHQLAIISNLSGKERQEYEEWKALVVEFAGILVKIDSKPTEEARQGEWECRKAEAGSLRAKIWTKFSGGNPACIWDEFERLEEHYYARIWQATVSPHLDDDPEDYYIDNSAT